jgi:hypothetical protein
MATVHKSQQLANEATEISASSSEPVNPGIGLVTWQWRWEIASSGLSIASMALVLAILTKTNNQPLKDWTLPIQPNSLISVCTTIGKSAMMVPVASCIGQLRWRYFAQRSRPLRDLQIFDDASRGPWGATMVLLQRLNKAWLITAFAIVTIISLGIEPSAQQILSFGTREVELVNVTARTGLAASYSSKTLPQSQYLLQNFLESTNSKRPFGVNA